MSGARVHRCAGARVPVRGCAGARVRRTWVPWWAGAIVLAIFMWAGPGVRPAFAQDMPDPALIHGRAIPAPELPAGTVTVRVVREAIGNNIQGQSVELRVGNTTRTARTDEEGRAQFSAVPGGEARAQTTVDGEALVSEPFAVPVTGGLRVILVAGLARAAERRKEEAATAAAAPPVQGVVVLGQNSRIILEFSNDTLTAFYVLEIVNSARTRVDVGEPIVIELPEFAVGAQAMDGNSPRAEVSEAGRITIRGPFAAGTTPVQAAFRVPYSGSTLSFSQTWPVALQRVTVGIEKIGPLTMTSPQFASTGDATAEGGQLYVLGTGPALAAGMPLTFTLTNLPVRSRVARNVVLGIVLLIAGYGTWLAVKVPGRAGGSRAGLEHRRDTLLGELAQLEAKRRGGIPPTQRQTARARQLLAELEQVYGELDDAGAGPRGGGEGVAA